MRNLIKAALAVTVLAGLSSGASAATITECASGSSCIPTVGMVDVFGNGTTGTLNFGSLAVNDNTQDVRFVTDVAVSTANGFAQIGVGNDTFNSLTISLNPATSTFHDLAFSVQSSGAGNINIAASDGTSSSFVNQGTEFFYVLQTAVALTSVTITAGLGTLITKVANVQFSFSPVPIPGAALLMGTALAGLAGFGAIRRRRKSGSGMVAA
jgi:MYXO-CTERM domain-containing protein